MSLLKMIKAQLGLNNTPGENHFWDGSVANQLSLKRGTPDSPGAKVIDIVNGKVEFPSGRTYASGEIIQQLMFTDAGGNMTGSLANITQSAKSITPKSTNSTIFVSVSFYGYPNSSGTYFNAQVRRTTQTAALIGDLISLGLTTSAAQAVFAGIVQAYQSNSATDVISFQLWGQNAAGSGGAINSLTFTITEVQN